MVFIVTSIKKSSRFTTIIVILLIVSILWFLVVLNLLYNLYIEENDTTSKVFNDSLLIKLISIVGIVLIGGYSVLILSKNSNNHNLS